MILVTGSRELKNRKFVEAQLDLHLNLHGRVDLVVGDCPTGADLFAFEWAHSQLLKYDDVSPVTYRIFAADWDRRCDQNCYHPKKFKPVKDALNPDGPEILVPYCPVAGNIRNQAMVDWIVSQDISAICLAFRCITGKNRGTSDCVRRARKAKFEVKQFMGW